MKRSYTVQVTGVPSVYPMGYFPRKYRYRKEAVDVATTVIELGATSVVIRCPNGEEIIFPTKTNKALGGVCVGKVGMQSLITLESKR